MESTLHMDLTQTLKKLASVTVLVVAANGMTERDFHTRYTALSKRNIATVTVGGDGGTKEKELVINYLQHVPVSDAYNEMEYSRNVLGMIGLMEGSGAVEFDRTAESLQTIGQAVNNPPWRCFVFNESESEISKSPPTGFFTVAKQEDDWVDTVFDEVKMLVSDIFDQLNIKLKKLTVEKAVTNVLKVGFEKVTLPEEIRLAHRRFPNRNMKLVADVELILGSFQEAQQMYSDALEGAKATSDWLWIGACHEGLCATTYMQDQRALTKEQTGEISDRMLEALNCYRRVPGALGLMMEATFRLANFYADTGGSILAASLLAGAATYDVQLVDLDKIRLYAGLARTYKAMGMARKSAFFVMQLVMVQQSSKGAISLDGWKSAAFTLLRHSLPAYNIDSLDRFVSFVHIEPTVKDTEEKETSEIESFPLNGWHDLQVQVLHDLILSSKALNDPMTTAEYIVFLLHTMREKMDSQSQASLVTLLQSLARHMDLASAHFHLIGMPTVLSLVPSQGTESLHLHSTSSNASRGKTPFIYSPFRQNTIEGKDQLYWCEGDVQTIAIRLANPMSFAVPVERLSLIANGVDFQSFSLSCSVPPKGSLDVTLHGRVLSSGTLHIVGVRLNVFGIVSDHCLPSQTIEVLPRFPQLIVNHSQLNTDAPNVCLELLEGEMVDTVLWLHNVGSDSIDWLEISCEPIKVSGKAKKLAQSATTTLDPHKQSTANQESDYAPRRPKDREREKEREIQLARDRLDSNQIQWNDESLSLFLPLTPGKSSSLPVTILGHFGSHGAELSFRYGSNKSSESYRVFKLSISLAVSRVLMFSRFDVLNINHIPPSTLSLLNMSETKGVSGDKTCPSQSSLCLLSFDVINNSRHCFGLRFVVRPRAESQASWMHAASDVTLEGYCVRRVLLPIDHLPHSFADSSDLRTLVAPTWNQVEVDWSLSARKVAGRMWLHNLPLPPSSLERLLAPPLSVCCVTESSKHTVKDTESFPALLNVDLLELVHVTVSILPRQFRKPSLEKPDPETKSVNDKVEFIEATNVENQPNAEAANWIKVRLLVYQDSTNGQRLLSLSQSMARLGQWEVSVSWEKAQAEGIEHKAAALFFASGIYHIIGHVTIQSSSDDTKYGQRIWASQPIRVHVQ